MTKRWMRDASDELAVRNGCWMDEKRGQFVVDWLYDYLRLYEGECAGQPFECKDWQYEATMRLFGWQRKSAEWGRNIRRFRDASIWVAKKNKKSPQLAAWLIFLCCGDGEQGQKCFPTAKNGNQIRENVGRHIHEMIRQSPALMAECKLNKQTKHVFYEPTRSLIMPLSSENIQTQKALEGLNGSTGVDEVHVVDKEHMKRISRAGISRSEPLNIQVSTAGNEPESYGMGRFKYAQGVISGENKDDQTLAIIHAAPQDVSDEEIHKDPLKYGRMANPSFGHTVHESEFLHDYEVSKKTVADFADFKMYRLNIWQSAVNPWLSIHDWRQCPINEDFLDLDRLTYGGLDLSRTTDFTAWLKYQPGKMKHVDGKFIPVRSALKRDTPRCSGHYWCPRERAVELSHQFEIPVLDWAEQGWVTLCDDNVIDRDDVHEYLQADAQDYSQLKYVGFDRYNADDTVKFAMHDLRWEMIDMAQGVQTLCAPSRFLEELVVLHRLDHRNDPVLAWMLQNTSVKIDENGNIKPVKTVGGVRKHIDGIVSLVMAICASMSVVPKRTSTYAETGML